MAVTDLTTCFYQRIAIAYELWVEKAFECSEISGLFCWGLEGKNLSRADDGALTCDISEERKDSARAICVIFSSKESGVSAGQRLGGRGRRIPVVYTKTSQPAF